MVQHQRSRPDGPGVFPDERRLHLHRPDLPGRRIGPQDLRHPLDHQAGDVPQRGAAEHDAVHVQQPHQARQALPEPSGRLPEHPQRSGVPGRCAARELVVGPLGALLARVAAGGPPVRQHRRDRAVGVQAALAPAAALPVAPSVEVPDLPGVVGDPAVHPVAEHQPGTDPGAEVHVDEGTGPLGTARPALPYRRGRGVVVQHHVQLDPLLQRVREGDVGPAGQAGWGQHLAASGVDRAGHRQPHAQHPAGIHRGSAHQLLVGPVQRVEHRVRGGFAGQSAPAAHPDRSGQVQQDAGDHPGIQVQADRRVRVRGDLQQHAAFAPGRGRPPVLGDQPLVHQRAHDVGHGLGGQTGLLRQFHPADLPVLPYRVEHHGSVEPAHPRQICSLPGLHRQLLGAAESGEIANLFQVLELSRHRV